MGRLIGLDVGGKRIGVALSDPLMLTAQGLETYVRRSEDEDIRYFEDLMAKNDVDRIVCGLPKHMNGSIGQQAELTKEFADKLAVAAGLPVTYFDERLSTAAALRTLREAEVSPKKRKKVVDKLAAVHILQGYMDMQSHAAAGGAAPGGDYE